MNTKPQKSHKKLDIRNALQPGLFSLDKSGNPHTRVVWAFDEEARKKQAEALRAMRSIRFPMPLATGSVPGKSLYDNVRPHRGAVKVYQTDFVDAFGSVSQPVLQEKVESILHKRARGRAHKDTRDTILTYMEDGAFLDGVNGLPQGNMTSQDLFNWYMAEADNALAHAMWERRQSYGEVATRYLDDLTVSSRSSAGLSRPFRRSIREIYANLAPGMEVSHHKSSLHGLDTNHPAVTITGLSLYNDGRIAPAPALLEAANEVFGDIAMRLANGESFTEHDFSVVAGYNGVLNIPGESGRSGSRTVREMGATAHSLLERLGPMVC